ncbi:hypothetical protein ASPVEDRAFT_83752 [Aspergillus versicolor CBS 583.65]|uniref:Lysine-specific metallo-endopeptidase domain-containing protein n=1 Tax=Aspergillus versicolor CBS 583.65 TaxID=1036611 RepID=A0A1L9PL94_ASPVE|nr:uncharacterized protein ASPVEDRAFT_83752 [Aspergillus versicolor CBS 583.65]OJJ02242.1 hypothetical protein ASPVEDRAFT_83752 [Aspergillus versicolor CBS 583.65]
MYPIAKHIIITAAIAIAMAIIRNPSPIALSTREKAQCISLEFENCSDNQKTVVQNAFNQAISMASISRNIDFDSDPAAKDFFGPSSLNQKYQGQINSIFDRIATFRIGCTPGVRVGVECVDCSRNSSETIAYVRNIQLPGPYHDGNRLSKTSPIIKFCKRFFRDYKSPEARVKEIFDFGREDWKPDLRSYTNQASLVLHEIMHADALVSAQNGNRRIYDIEIKVENGSGEYLGVYGAEKCKTLARTVPERRNAKISLIRDGITSNADTYAQFALAKYVQKKLNGQ